METKNLHLPDLPLLSIPAPPDPPIREPRLSSSHFPPHHDLSLPAATSPSPSTSLPHRALQEFPSAQAPCRALSRYSTSHPTPTCSTPSPSPPRRSFYLAGVLPLYHSWWDSRNPVLQFFQKIALLENSYLLVYNSELGDSFCVGSQIVCSFSRYKICLCLNF